ncbi:hypothetical protein AXFE_30570 [Acidithrix ferrooxidans]|uniref:Uncharacterized protein n=1 Tax=Acidithrix ferrooxidans TaxID=1280514 RepID=A0A0D8HGA4_9ACTN|nr:hypothetical protein AXFE_30570 [Acidithrix ferrooxidans]
MAKGDLFWFLIYQDGISLRNSVGLSVILVIFIYEFFEVCPPPKKLSSFIVKLEVSIVFRMVGLIFSAVG